MPLSNWTFTVNGQSVTPQNNDLNWREDEDEDLGLYIRRLSTELIFKGDDYDYFNNNWEVSGICEDLTFEARFRGTLIDRGFLKMGSENCNWDFSNCTLRATIDPSGDFQCLQDNWEDEINILSLMPTYTIETTPGTISDITCGPVSGAAPIAINGFFEQNVSGCLTYDASLYTPIRYYIVEVSPGTRYDHYCTWAFEQVVTTCSGATPTPPPGDGWGLVINNCPTNATYQRAPQRSYVGEQSATTGNYFDNLYEIAGSSYDSMDNGLLLKEVLSTKKPSCISSVVSDFFSLNPSGDAPSNAAYTAASEQLEYLMVFQKSDVKRPDVVNNATVAETTFKDLLQSLKAQFNIKWSISNGVLRVEHYSFFTRANGLDLTVAPYLQHIQGLKAYNYEGTQVPTKEVYSYMETVSAQFVGQPIYYLKCVTQDAEELPVPYGDVNNDVSYIQSNPDLIDDSGLTYVEAWYDGSSSYYLVSRESALGGDLVLNASLSTPNLHENYHKWGKFLDEARVNNVISTINTPIPRKRESRISIPLSPTDFATFDANNLIRSHFGWSEIQTLEYSAALRTLTLNLRHA